MDGTGALGLILAGDANLFAIVRLSLLVSLTASGLAAVLALPLGALLGVARFRGRDGVIILCNGLMGLPPVVVGLVVFLLLSRSGPLGSFGLLFTPIFYMVVRNLADRAAPKTKSEPHAEIAAEG